MSNSILIASYVINAIWQIALIAMTGCLLARLLRRFSPKAEHALCVLTLVAAIFLPATPVLRAIFYACFPTPGAGAHILFAPVTIPDNPTAAEGVFTLSSAIIKVIALLYVGSFCYFAARLLWSLQRTAKLLQSADPLALSPAHAQVLSQCLNAFPIKTPRIFSSIGVSGPVVLELRGAILLVPPEFATNCSPQEFLTALAHELGHIERRDFLKNLWYEAISLFAAFHPAIWLIKAQIAQSREMICDRIATERVVAPGTYARSLLSLASMVTSDSRTATANPIGMFDANILEKRIMMLNSKNRRIHPLGQYGLTTLAILFVLAVSVVSSNASIAIEASQTSSQSNSVGAGKGTGAGDSAGTSPAVGAGAIGRVYKVGKDVSVPVPIKAPNAEFPEAAKHAKEPVEAIVVVGLVVDAEGMPRQLKIVSSYRADFDAQALKAVEQYRFTPGKHAGKAVATAVNIAINFKKY